ncbi:MAG TPA: MFS transporter, partial [Terriglobia bacterium]|nr:MFS transporter [Terriglobia bacterium]
IDRFRNVTSDLLRARDTGLGLLLKISSGSTEAGNGRVRDFLGKCRKVINGAHDSALPAPLSRIRSIQKTALILLLISGVINYVDRASLAVGLPLIRHDLGISIAHSGLLLSAFLCVYAICQLPAGAAVDRFGARLVLSAGLILWSLAQVLGGLVSSFQQFLAVRGFLGVGESPQYPSCARIVTDWFAQRDRGIATGIWNCSSSLGTAVAVPLLTVLMIHLGWRWMFITMGVAGLTMGIAFYSLHRDPKHFHLSGAELKYLSSEQRETRRLAWRDWQRLFGFSTTLGMVCGFFGLVYMSWLYYAWLPQYLEIQWHLSIARTGWVAAIPFACGVAGSLAVGRVCDILCRRGVSAINSYKIPIVCALFGVVLCTALAAYSPSSLFAVVCISLSLFLLNGGSTAAWAMATVAAPETYVASLGSIQNFGGYIGGAVAPVVTGYMAQATASFQSALLVAAGVALLAGIMHLFFVREPISLTGK